MMTDPREHRDELRRLIDACEDGAVAYEEKAAELRRDAEIARAELRGLELALDALRADHRMVPRRPVFPLTPTNGEDD